MATCFDVLGIDHTTNFVDAKQAYKDKLLKAHPDKGGSNADFLEVQGAFESFKTWYRNHLSDKLTLAIELKVAMKEIYDGTVKKLATRSYNHSNGQWFAHTTFINLCDFRHVYHAHAKGDVGIDGVCAIAILILFPKTLETAPIIVLAVLVVPIVFWAVYLTDCVQVASCKPASWVIAISSTLITLNLVMTAFAGPVLMQVMPPTQAGKLKNATNALSKKGA
eukprot:gene19623-26306_t